MPENENLDAGQIEELMNYDPFEPKEEPAAEAVPEPAAAEAGGEAAEEQVGSEPEQPAETSEQQAEEQPAAAGVTSEELVELRRELAELRTQRAQPQGQQQQETQQPRQSDPTAIYDQFQIPPAINNALMSEDPQERIAGVRQLAIGIAKVTHTMVARQMEQRFNDVPTMIQNHAVKQEQMKAIHDDFYGKHKDLNRPELKTIVVETSKQVAQELGTDRWNARLRDETAKRVRTLLGLKAPVTPAQRKAPGGVVQTGARPAPAQGDANSPSAIADALSLFGPGA